MRPVGRSASRFAAERRAVGIPRGAWNENLTALPIVPEGRLAHSPPIHRRRWCAHTGRRPGGTAANVPPGRTRDAWSRSRRWIGGLCARRPSGTRGALASGFRVVFQFCVGARWL